MDLYLDTETTGLDLLHGCQPFLIVVLCDGKKHVVEWSVNPHNRQVIPRDHELRNLQTLLREATRIIGWNVAFDALALQVMGLELDASKLFDVQVLAHLQDNAAPMGLKARAFDVLGIPDIVEKFLQREVVRARATARKLGWCVAEAGLPSFGGRTNGEWSKSDYWLLRTLFEHFRGENVPRHWRDLAYHYCHGDVICTAALHRYYESQLTSELDRRLIESRTRLLRVLYDMRSVGLAFFPEVAHAITQELRHEIQGYQATLEKRLGPINLNSPKQLLAALNAKGIHLFDTNAQTLATAVTGKLRASQHLTIQTLLAYRKRSKIKDYITSYRKWAKRSHEQSRVYPSLNLTGTRFTRQSSKDPNFQNVPNEIARKCFGPPENHKWWRIDYSNLELRIWAYLSKNARLIQAFENGEDVHAIVCKTLHPDLADMPIAELKKQKRYKQTKAGEFSMLYGAGEKRANDTFHLEDGYQRMVTFFPEIRNFTQECHQELLRFGFVRSCYGYPLRVPLGEPHKSVSAKIQGSAGCIMREAMISCADYLRRNTKQCKLAFQIHDEVIFEAKQTCPQRHLVRIQELMEEAGTRVGIKTPVSAEEITYPEKWL